MLDIFKKKLVYLSQGQNISIDQKEKLADDLMNFYNKNITTSSMRKKFGFEFADHLFLFKETEERDIEQLIKDCKENKVDEIEEEKQIMKIKQLI